MANGLPLSSELTLEVQLFKLLNHAFRCQQTVAAYEALTPERKAEFDTQMGIEFISSIRLNSTTTLDMRLDPSTGDADYLVKIGFAVGISDGRIKLIDYRPEVPLDKLFQAVSDLF